MENTGNQPKRFCRKCLLQDMDEGQYFDDMRRYIDNLDEDLKVSSQLYDERLAFCRKCDNLISGMCRVCGCFVEMRAVMKKNGCPGFRRNGEKEEPA